MDTNNLLAEIKKLPENEFLPFMQDLAEHIRKNDWEHLIDKCFDIEDGEDEIRQLERDIDDLEEDKDELRREKKELESVIEEIKKLVN